MARIRTIKPDFWTSDQVVDCSPLARLSFLGLLNFCDDRGVHPASPKRLKLEVFPGDDIDLAPLVEELLAVNLIETFEAEGEMYWHVTKWDKHQKISHPAYRFPKPPGWKPPEESGGLRSNPEPSALNGTERNGIDRKGIELRASTSDVAADAHEVDWGKAREDANRVLQKTGIRGMTSQDRSLVIKASAMAQTVCEDFLWDAVEAVRLAFERDKPPGGNRCAYFHGVLESKAKLLGRNFKAMLVQLHPPPDLLGKREVETSSPG